VLVDEEEDVAEAGAEAGSEENEATCAIIVTKTAILQEIARTLQPREKEKVLMVDASFVMKRATRKLNVHKDVIASEAGLQDLDREAHAEGVTETRNLQKEADAIPAQEATLQETAE
jgi:predicted amino acid dehydrogenase